jgi:DHA3 family macrolide efflux protein-like MFS transporter
VRLSAGTEPHSVLRDLVDGLALVAGSRILVGTMLTCMVTMLGLGALEVLFVPFITRTLNAPTSAVGLVQGTQIAGMIAGSALVGFFTKVLGRGRLIGSAVGLMGILIAGAGAISSLPALLLLTFGAGFCVAPINAAGSTMLQHHVPAQKLGRALSALSTLITLASVLSMALAGAFGDALGIRAVFYLAGAITLLSGLLGFWALNEKAG